MRPSQNVAGARQAKKKSPKNRNVLKVREDFAVIFDEASRARSSCAEVSS
jgi:hypothetical protein